MSRELAGPPGDLSEHVRPPGVVIGIVRTLQRAGFETWCVGGAVRDALLGHPHLDWDLATAATPAQVRRLFERTVPIGIEFGTVGVLDERGTMHEVTTFRRDVQHDGRHAIVEFGASLDEDLARRDFTINAMAYEPVSKRLHDPFGGRADLDARVVRAVGDAEARMEEDRLRALRAIRFAARFDFRLDASTWQAIVHSAPFLSRLSPERVKQEIEKSMEQVASPSRAFTQWRECGAFASLVPTLAGVSDDVLRALDALPMPGLPGRPQRRVLRITALLSGLAGSDAERVARELRFSNHDIAWIAALVSRYQQHGEPLRASLCSAAGVSDGGIRRLASAVGRLRVGAFVRLCAARWSAREVEERPSRQRVRDLQRRLQRAAFREAIEIADLAVDGDDLRRAGVPAGRRMGQLLVTLLDDVIDAPERNTRDWLLTRAIDLSTRAE